MAAIKLNRQAQTIFVFILKAHQAVFGEFTPVDAGVFLGVNHLFLALGAPPLGLIREKFDLCAALRAFDIADFQVFFPTGTLSEHIKSRISLILHR